MVIAGFLSTEFTNEKRAGRMREIGKGEWSIHKLVGKERRGVVFRGEVKPNQKGNALLENCMGGLE